MAKIIPKFGGFVEKGILEILDIDKLKHYVKSLKGPVVIIVKQRKRIRSLGQNALYWVYLTLLAQEGHTPEELHDIFKEAYIPAEKITAFGIEANRYKTTTDMDPMEFNSYIKKIEIRTGVLCPDPEKMAREFTVE